jgi:hypothetical protein
MTRPGIAVLAWAALLTVLATVLGAWTDDNVPKAIYFASAGLMWAVGLVALARGRGWSGRMFSPDLSFPSVFVAFAVAMLAVGALVGRWLVYVGAGALLIGVLGVARELAAQRKAAE